MGCFGGLTAITSRSQPCPTVVLAFLLAGILAHGKLQRQGENGEEAEGGLGEALTTVGGAYAGQNLVGDEMAGGSSVGCGV